MEQFVFRNLNFVPDSRHKSFSAASTSQTVNPETDPYNFPQKELEKRMLEISNSISQLNYLARYWETATSALSENALFQFPKRPEIPHSLDFDTCFEQTRILLGSEVCNIGKQ